MKWIGQHIWDLTSRFRGISIFEKAIKLLKSDGGDGGVISMTGNDMVLSNTAGDVLIGSTTYQVGGDQDIFIGDGTNSVDLIFEQPGSIRGYDSSVNLTIGGGGGVITFADAVEFTNDITVSSLNYASSRGWVEDSQPMYSQTGFYGGNFIRSGEDSENETVWGLDPFGNKGLLWKAIQGNTDDNADGGWNKDITIPANNNVGYISYIYFKIDFTPDNNNDGSFYHGCGQNTGETLSLAGASNTNPYFNSGRANELGFGGTPIEANKWYLSVGILQAYNNSTTDTDTVSGIYEVDTGKKIRGGSEFKMGDNTTGQRHRVYWYYSTTSDVQNAYFWGPGFHAIDGTEPKIQDLVRSASFGSSYQAGRDAQNFIDFTTDNVIKFTTNSSEALRIDSSGRVGINTTSPSSELEVVSSGANGIVLGEDTSNSTVSSRLFFDNATSGQGVTLLNAGGGLAIFTGATPGSSSGTERIKMASNGSLGIGTSSPSKKLHVNGDTLLDGDLTVNGINYGLYHATTEDGYYSESYEGSRHLTMFIKNARADIIRYGSVGNLEYWNGSSWVDGSSQIANLKKLLDGRQDTRWDIPSTYYKFRFSVYPSTAWPTRAKIGIQTGWSGSTWPGATMLVEEYDGSSWATKVTADFGGQAGGSATPLNSNDNDVDNWGLMFKTDNALHTGNGNSSSYNSGLNTRITIDFYGWSPSNPSYVTIPLQNIFITSNYSGTENTDYTNLLDYDRDVAIPNAMTVAGNTTMSGRVDIQKDLRLRGTDAAASQGVVRFYVDNTNKLFIDTANDGSGFFVIDSLGRVGIGTTSPAQKLNVVGDVKIHNTGSGNNATLFIDTVSGGNADSILNFREANVDRASLYWDGGDNDLYLTTTTGDFLINPSGNVGIGTTSPDSLLEISSSSATDFLKLTSGGGGANPVKLIFEKSSVEQGVIEYNRNGDLEIYNIDSDGGVMIDGSASAGGDLYVNNAGNVGIGTTSPSEKLEVNGNIKIGDSDVIKIGTGNDLQLFHDGTDSMIDNLTGNFYIRNQANDKDIIFICDNGSGGTETYFRLDGSASSGDPITIFPDNSKLAIGESSHGITLVHDGSNSSITNAIGDLTITNFQNDGDIIFKSDDGSGGTTEYFRLDGSEGHITVQKEMHFQDTVVARFGTDNDAQIVHSGNSLSIVNQTGNFNVVQNANDGDITFQCDDGSGGTTEYFRVDGGDEKIVFSKKINATDINFSGLPTSSAGLSSGDVWNDGGTLKIVS